MKSTDYLRLRGVIGSMLAPIYCTETAKGIDPEEIRQIITDANFAICDDLRNINIELDTIYEQNKREQWD